MMLTTWAEQDFQKREERHERWLASRPVCDFCGEPVQEDVYFEPEPGTCYCPDCFNDYIRDNFMRDIPESE